MRKPNRLLLYFVLMLHLLLSSKAQAHELTGFVSLEGRYFLEGDRFTGQSRGHGLSLVLEPEYFHLTENNKHQFTIKPFLRIDSEDTRRTHFDLRQLFWLYQDQRNEFLFGLDKVFWGVTESRHLVDILNQTDLIEDIDEEDKFGQPMIMYGRLFDWGSLKGYVMPYFRERTFPGKKGRLRPVVAVDVDEAEYESAAAEWHTDLALRYSHTVGNVDFGAYHFYGTSREPEFLLRLDDFELIPRYEIIHQTGIDAQYTKDAWLLKFEGIFRSGQARSFFASVIGFEYTFFGIRETNLDIGLLSEFLYDDRDGNSNFTVGNEDLFLGTRITWNDVNDTELLMGVIIDLEDGSLLTQVEGSRRFGDRWKLSVDGRFISNVDNDNALFQFKAEDHIIVTLQRFF